MKLNLRLFCVIIFYLALMQPTFSQENYIQSNNIQSNNKKIDSGNTNNLVNKFIDKVFQDFFLKENLHGPELNSVYNPFNDKIEDSEIKRSVLSPERQLDLGLSEKSASAKLIVLDKIYGVSKEIEVFQYKEVTYNSIKILLKGCFYKKENLEIGSVALISIFDSSATTSSLKMWVSSTHSHLTNYNNYRYSLWLLSCIISDQEKLSGR